MGYTHAGFKISGTINRKDFNISYGNSAMIGDEVNIICNIELVKK